MTTTPSRRPTPPTSPPTSPPLGSRSAMARGRQSSSDGDLRISPASTPAIPSATSTGAIATSPPPDSTGTTTPEKPRHTVISRFFKRVRFSFGGSRPASSTDVHDGGTDMPPKTGTTLVPASPAPSTTVTTATAIPELAVWRPPSTSASASSSPSKGIDAARRASSQSPNRRGSGGADRYMALEQDLRVMPKRTPSQGFEIPVEGGDEEGPPGHYGGRLTLTREDGSAWSDRANTPGSDLDDTPPSSLTNQSPNGSSTTLGQTPSTTDLNAGLRPPHSSTTVGQFMRRFRTNDKAQLSQRDHWIKDETCKACYQCEQPFTFLRRRHHCRICGKILCARCTIDDLSGEPFGYVGPIRVCTYCKSIIDECSKDADSPPPSPRPPSILGAPSIRSTRPRSLFESGDATALAPFRWPSGLVDDDPTSPSAAPDGDDPVAYESEDDDDEEENYNVLTPRQLVEATYSRPPSPTIEDETRRRTFIQRRRSLPARTTSVLLNEFWKEPEYCGPLLEGTCQAHAKALIHQVVSEATLHPAWETVLFDLASDVVRKVAFTSEVMDIRHFLRVKKIPGSRPAHSMFLSGAVCKKSLAHRKMPTSLTRPRIVILTFPIEYHRVQDQLMSLNPVLAQEHEHLLSLCNRLLALQPTIILVEKTVSRFALEYLVGKGIAVSYDIKRPVLETVARFTGADLITSMDKLSQSPAVGTCGSFSAQMFAHDRDVTPLLVFDGCPAELGGCVILRGEDRTVLKTVKRMLWFVIFAVMSLHRESQLYTNLQAKPASVPVADAQALVVHDELLVKLLKPYQVLLSVSPGIAFPPPYLIERYRDEVQRAATRPRALSRSSSISSNTVVTPTTGPSAKVWGGPAYASGIDRVSRDALNYILDKNDSVTPIAHQSLLFLTAMPPKKVPQPAHAAAEPQCARPSFQYVEYYGQDDITLVQYVEHVVETAAHPCPQCHLPLHQHHRVYYHGRMAVTVAVGDDSGDPANPGAATPRASSDGASMISASSSSGSAGAVKSAANARRKGQLLAPSRPQMQTYCCECKTWGPRTDMSVEAGAYSFAKYLELAFYNTAAVCATCGHRAFADCQHVFYLGGSAVTVSMQPVTLYEMSFPLMRVQLDPARALAAKEKLSAQVQDLVVALYASVERYISQHWHQLAAAGAGVDDEGYIRDLCLMANHEKSELLDMTREIADHSPVYETLAFTKVLAILMNRSGQWMEKVGRVRLETSAAAAAMSPSSGVAGSVPGNDSLATAVASNSPGPDSPASLAPAWVMRALQEMAGDNRNKVGPKPDLPTPSTSPPSTSHLVEIGDVIAPAPTSATSRDVDADPLPVEPLPASHSPTQFPVLDKDVDVVTRPPSAKTDKSETKKASGLVQSLVNLLISAANPTSSLPPLTSIMNPTEHLFPGSTVIVREDEPTSIVAFALRSAEYASKLEKVLQQADAATTEVSLNDVGSPSPFREIQNQEHDEPVEDVDEDALDDHWLEQDPSARGHIDVEATHGPLKVGCRTYFAAEFQDLRQNCLVEEYFAHSLARCAVWEANGGKSGSTFLKTQDDRFVIKQLSKVELELFGLFAPAYFAYMNRTIFNQIPTILAKIFGVYRIALKNSVTGKSSKLDFLVMENLFYGKKITKLFDLKGSTRNRYVTPVTGKTQTLLDGNYIELMRSSPLFTREYARKVLTTSIYNDTLFLSKLNIMDYSLLIGIDDENHQLVVGIVDFIRAYTWDKKLESWVKEQGFLGGGGKEPTIVSPKQYKTRFRDAMERYFWMVPDKFCSVKAANRNVFS
ncbi:1-phosphatidylinositol-3-phosphate 5-kinase [Allomyces arbusculus]|nr:1-phosphatidylinositol-3-phosphate 5-kinase [Allomyces arbusculus]